jgi:hypothetical protein
MTSGHPVAPMSPLPYAAPGANGQTRPRSGQEPDIWIADDLFLIAHRERDGKPLLPGRVMGLALTGAALCELALAGRVTIDNGMLVVLNDADPAEALGQWVLTHLLSQPNPLPLRDWLAYLASSVTAAVGDRLSRAGTVQARKGFRGLRFVPVDSTDAFYRAGRLAVTLDNGGPLSTAQKALIGLVYAVGLLEQLPCVDPARVRARVPAIVQSLQWPLTGLIAETTMVVDNAIATGRI